MSAPLLLSITALMALVPGALVPWRAARLQRPAMLYWPLLLTALVTVAAVVTISLEQDGWNSGLALALWVTVFATLTAFAALVALRPVAWRLLVILNPYLLVCGVLATLSGQMPSQVVSVSFPQAWLWGHIGFSLFTYGLVTVAAMAGAGVFLQERALKSRAPKAFTSLLPSVADGEALERFGLLAAEIVLGLGIATGMALAYFETGSLLSLDHKTLLSLLAFVVIGVILWLMQKGSLRGRLAARVVLIAYLLLTLAYPGVKFVTDVLLS